MKEKRGHRCVEVRRSDIDLADRLLSEVLGRSLDELPPQTRRVLELIEGYVTARSDDAEIRFTRRDLREATSLGDTQLKVHLARLVDLEYLLVEKRGRRYHYELVNSPATGRGTVAHRSANGRGSANGEKANAANGLAANGRIIVENVNGAAHTGSVVSEVHA